MCHTEELLTSAMNSVLLLDPDIHPFPSQVPWHAYYRKRRKCSALACILLQAQETMCLNAHRLCIVVACRDLSAHCGQETVAGLLLSISHVARQQHSRKRSEEDAWISRGGVMKGGVRENHGHPQLLDHMCLHAHVGYTYAAFSHARHYDVMC